MMRSLYSGVSGLKTHQTKMDVIGNNIANVNTTSYKSMSINFSDLMYQTTQAATGPNPTTGVAGTNPRQIGLGVQTAAISTKITEEGATQSTGNPFDLKISGDEFFVVSDGSNTYFTRDGSFYVDAAGNLAMSSTGYNVMGWQVDPDTGNIKKDTVSPLVVMSEDNLSYEAEYTQAATAGGILDWNDSDQSETSGKILNLQIYDNLGYSYTVKMSLHNAHKAEGTDDNYSFYAQLDDIVDSTGKSVLKGKEDKVKFGEDNTGVNVSQPYGLKNGSLTTMPATGTTSATAYVSIKMDTDGDATTPEETISFLLYPDNPAATPANSLFNADGTLNDINNILIKGNTNPVTVSASDLFKAVYGDKITATDIKGGTFDPSTGVITVTNRDIKQSAILKFSGKNGKFVESGSTGGEDGVALDLSQLGDAFSKINIDFSKAVVSDNKGKSTIAVEKGDISDQKTGRSLGTLQGVSIQTNGMIYASYTNGQKKLLGQIAVAEFANASGLQKEGDNLYSSTNNSGDFNGIGIDITANGDSMNTGVLEMSNVDLSSEFTEMITTQRGFQANSRIITVSDTLLEELTNLKR